MEPSRFMGKHGGGLLQCSDLGVAYRHRTGNHARFERNITAFSTGFAAIFSDAEDLQASCNVFWGNEENFFGYVPAPTDRLIDPLLCNWEAGDVHLSSPSPCLPDNSGGCGLIGARGEGCGTVSVEDSSWARIKSWYRGE